MWCNHCANCTSDGDNKRQLRKKVIRDTKGGNKKKIIVRYVSARPRAKQIYCSIRWCTLIGSDSAEESRSIYSCIVLRKHEGMRLFLESSRKFRFLPCRGVRSNSMPPLPSPPRHHPHHLGCGWKRMLEKSHALVAIMPHHDPRRSHNVRRNR